jgi:hypothetical protein
MLKPWSWCRAPRLGFLLLDHPIVNESGDEEQVQRTVTRSLLRTDDYPDGGELNHGALQPIWYVPVFLLAPLLSLLMYLHDARSKKNSERRGPGPGGPRPGSLLRSFRGSRQTRG